MREQATAAQAALDGLKDAFYALDTQQREMRKEVESYSLHLPGRVNKSGLIPRFTVLDAESDSLIREYLDTLDRFPLTLKMRPEAISASANAFVHLRDRIQRQVSVLVQFVADYDAEFRRVGAELERVHRMKTESAAALADITQVWQDFRAEGYESADADRALAKARVAGRAVERWTVQQGGEALEEAAALVTTFSEEVTVITREFPAQVRRARTRGVTLRTHLEALDTRSESVADDLRALRREFSLANFHDLESTEKTLLDKRRELVPMLSSFDDAAAREDWQQALVALSGVEQALDDFEAVVSGPRRRLDALRAFKADPGAVMGQARFDLRDAQRLVLQTSGEHQRRGAARLDGLAGRLDAVPRLLEAVHPDYLHALNDLDAIRQDVKKVVDDVRRQQSSR